MLLKWSKKAWEIAIPAAPGVKEHGRAVEVGSTRARIYSRPSSTRLIASMSRQASRFSSGDRNR